MTITRTVLDVDFPEDVANGVAAGTAVTIYRTPFVEGLTGAAIEEAFIAEARDVPQVVVRYDGEDPFVDVQFPYDDTPGEMEGPLPPYTDEIIQDVLDAL